jgi:beta-glucanase (GH16 family)
MPGPEGSMVMTLDQKNLGTRLSSTRYVHYGEISAQIKTGKWAGVVTAFITMSDMKDEIDWEFPGTATTEGQTNVFWQGNIPDLTQGSKSGGLTDTSANWHTYTINWLPETLTFAIDGKTVRTVKKADSADSAGADGYKYPSTPSRVQLSIWPGGLNTSAPGTIAWAGGPINFNDPDFVAAGHFYASVKDVTVKCADPQTPGSNITGYVYGTGASSTKPSVSFTNASTLVKSGALPRALAMPAHTLGALALAVVGAMAANLL